MISSDTVQVSGLAKSMGLDATVTFVESVVEHVLDLLMVTTKSDGLAL